MKKQELLDEFAKVFHRSGKDIFFHQDELI